jgi:hypothetical protein
VNRAFKAVSADLSGASMKTVVAAVLAVFLIYVAGMKPAWNNGFAA